MTKSLLTGVLVFCFAACSKNASKSTGSRTGGTTTLSLSQQNVQKGQPLIASIPSSVSAAEVHWSVSPASITHITTANGQAMVLFAQAGNYKITASYTGTSSGSADSSWASVTVSDTVYAPPAGLNYDTTSLAGDQVTITPLTDSSSNLIFFAQSTKNYGCFDNYMYSITSGMNGNGGIGIDFFEVVSGSTSSCSGAQNPASAYFFPLAATSIWANGTYPFTVQLNGSTYSGSLVVTATGYSFVWNYNSGVIISPLQVNK